MKLKTHSGSKKRIKITGTGKLVAQKPAKRHLLINKSKRQKALDPRGKMVHSTDLYRLRKLLGR